MLKVGLIGCGFMGTMHANCYKNIEGVEIAALADIRREKAEALAEGTNAVIFGDGYDLIEEADVDIIDICLPTFLHAAYAMRAMEKVGYLFVEKPVALTAEEGAAMIAKAAATGCRVQIGQVIRFWDEYVALKEILDSGKYGKVVNANFRRLSPRPEWGWENWLLDGARSGGAGQDLHIHDVDYVLSLFGEPKSFQTVRNRIGEPRSYVNTLLEYDGFPVSIEGTWDLPASYPFTANFRVVLERAVIENASAGFMLYTAEGATPIVIEKKELLGAVEGGNISDLGGYYNELVYFTSRAKAGEEIGRATLSDGVASLGFVLRELAK